MPEVFHFGPSQRALLGLRHSARIEAQPEATMLICMPLLQEGIRCQRALWSLSEALAAAGIEVVRFDWFGSGDSGGTSADIAVAGLIDDIASATRLLHASSAGTITQPRLLALRSAALPLLAHAAGCRKPVDVVLWAPVLDGQALAASWREQHRRQLHTAGRFLGTDVAVGDDELLGFVLAPSLLQELGALDARALLLPPGSRLMLAQWASSPVDDAFVAAQRAAGVAVERFDLEDGDEPAWDDPDQFETQLFPRRAVNRIAARLAGGA